MRSVPARPSMTVLLLAAFTLSIAACDDDYLLPIADTTGVADRGEVILTLTGNVADGDPVFTQHCAVCHDSAGDTVKTGPALRPYMATADDARIVELVLTGLPPLMPAFSSLDDQEIADLVSWLHDSFDP